MRVTTRRWPTLLLAVVVTACSTTSVSGLPSTTAFTTGSTTPSATGDGSSAGAAPGGSSTSPTDSLTSSTSAASTSTSSSTSTTVAITIEPAGGFADVAAGAALRTVPADAHVAGAAADEPILYKNGCHVPWPAVDPKLCVFGDPTSSTVVVVTGDSHAAAWFGAFETAATTNHWKLVMVTKSGCPAADVTVYNSAPNMQNKRYSECDAWRSKAIEAIRNLHPTVVVFPMLSRRAVIGFKKPALGAWQAGLGRSIGGVAGPGVKVLVLGDTPLTRGQQVPACVGAHRADVSVCANTCAKAVLTDRLAMEQAAATDHGALFVDVSDWICADTVCPVVIGGEVVYRDEHHLTDRFSRSRGPQVAAAVQLALAGPDAH